TWRQTDGYMIARNFYEVDSNILYPRVDVFGNSSGIVGCEFPILNYLVYLLSVVFGYHSWFGRLINLIVSSTGVYFLYLLVRDYFGKQAALNTGVIVLSSIWFTYNRTNVPDTFGASLCIISLYFGIKYLKNQRNVDLTVFLLAGMIGCLSRISTAVILTLIVIPFFYSETTTRARVMTSLVALLIFSATCLWYFAWVPHLAETYNNQGHFFMGYTFAEGIKSLTADIPIVLKRFYDTSMKYIAFVVFFVSLVFAFKSRNWLVVAIFFIPFFTYSIITLKIAIGLVIDAYYAILYMLPMAFVAGWGLAQIPKKSIMIILLLAIGIEGVANQIHVFEIRQPYKSM
ncbi:MAG TPA: glycosyltransferase family 39 protein, partial [Cyclobacteriaceae bacterium]